MFCNFGIFFFLLSINWIVLVSDKMNRKDTYVSFNFWTWLKIQQISWNGCEVGDNQRLKLKFPCSDYWWKLKEISMLRGIYYHSQWLVLNNKNTHALREIQNPIYYTSFSFSRSFTKGEKKKKRKIHFSYMCHFSIEITKSQIILSGFKPHSSTIMLQVLLRLNCYCILPRNIWGKRKKTPWKCRVKRKLRVDRVKNHIYQENVVQGEEMRARYPY